jgi:hypothetical protein
MELVIFMPGPPEYRDFRLATPCQARNLSITLIYYEVWFLLTK